jgi:serine/threonine-protein kinase
VKVLDFGISKALGGTSVEELSLTKTAALIGSPLYMAPEQMRSAKDVDTRADIWSLGAMLYEMLTGQSPYTGESIPQLCAALLHDDPIPLRQHRAEIPEGLEQVVLRCLQKDRNHRYPTVYDLGRALLPFAAPDSRIHVERAERVLGATDVSMSTMGMMSHRSALPMVSSPTPSMPITPFASSPPVVRHADPTVNSWGQSGNVAPPKRRGPLLIGIAALAAVVAGGVGLWAARSSAPDTKGPAPSALAHAETVKPDKPALPAPPVEAAIAPPVVAPPPADSAAIAVTPPEPAPLTPPKHRPPVAAAPVAAAKIIPPKKTETKKPDAPAAPGKTGGITDFGGRR